MRPHNNTSRLQFVRLCDCGCGQPTLLATRTCARDGTIKDQPLRFIASHQTAAHLPGSHSASRTYKSTAERYFVDERGCWVWQGDVTSYGYGSITWREDGKRYRIGAHRYFYQRKYGPIPTGLHLDHLCRNPLCVNPDHLEPVTHAENLRRGNSTKLSVIQVAAIRDAYASGSASHRKLSRQYGVHHSTIAQIVTGGTWRG